MITPETLKYLAELGENNHKPWFDANKTRYETHVKKPFEQLVTAFITELETVEGPWFLTPKDCIHRIYRDVRFSNDKTLYKTHIGAMFSKGGKKNMAYPGYYLEIAAGRVQFGGGAYFLEKEPLHAMRTHILRNPDAFSAIVGDPDFAQKLGGVRGEKNARLDIEFREAAVAQPLLFNKQFYFMSDDAPEAILGPCAVAFLMEKMRAARPFNEFCRAALGF